MGSEIDREESLQDLHSNIHARFNAGEELIRLEVSLEANPWVEFAGMFKDVPMIDEWKRAMADYCKEIDDDPDYP